MVEQILLLIRMKSCIDDKKTPLNINNGLDQLVIHISRHRFQLCQSYGIYLLHGRSFI